MKTKALMFQGTGSDVGKSMLVAGIARALAKRGLKVCPFKPQNMSNNAAVTDDGGEIGRAQALQARAAGLRPTVHMNPVLLKPQSDIGSQVIVQGQVQGNVRAADFQAIKASLMEKVLESFHILAKDADIMLVEGAGSASEVNLRKNDIANMGFARALNIPVILIGDIDRGGVIASLVGTREIIEPEDAERIKGFIVNKFRGDPSLFASGMDLVASRTGWHPVGLMPYFKQAHLLPAEDAVALSAAQAAKDHTRFRIAVLVLPHIANFDDLDPLAAEPDVELIRIRPGDIIPPDVHMVILPGSKATISDLEALLESGLDIDLKAHVRRGGYVLGLCGGYQMLGHTILDPDGIEGERKKISGLGLLDVTTTMTQEKRLVSVEGESFDHVPLKGYEMHMGSTEGPDCALPFSYLKTENRTSQMAEGAVSPSGKVIGTYIHGLFADDRQRSAWLKRLGGHTSSLDYERMVDHVLDLLAQSAEENLDMDYLLNLAECHS